MSSNPYPPKPGSDEARALIAAWRASRCQHAYQDSLGGICCEPARYPADDPRWCAAHRRGARPKFNEPTEAIPRFGRDGRGRE